MSTVAVKIFYDFISRELPQAGIFGRFGHWTLVQLVLDQGPIDRKLINSIPNAYRSISDLATYSNHYRYPFGRINSLHKLVPKRTSSLAARISASNQGTHVAKTIFAPFAFGAAEVPKDIEVWGVERRKENRAAGFRIYDESDSFRTFY